MRDAKNDNSPKERITLYLSRNHIERAKNAVYWIPGLTLTELSHSAFKNELERLENENGGPFPSRKTRQLKSGRPIK